MYTLSGETVEAITQRAESSGLTKSALVDVLLRAALAKITDDGLRKLAETRVDGRRRTGLLADDVRVRDAMWALVRQGDGWFHGIGAVAAASGLTRVRCQAALNRLKSLGIVDHSTVELGEDDPLTGQKQRLDQYGRPVYSSWWLVQARKEAFEKIAAARAAAGETASAS